MRHATRWALSTFVRLRSHRIGMRIPIISPKQKAGKIRCQKGVVAINLLEDLLETRTLSHTIQRDRPWRLDHKDIAH